MASMSQVMKVLDMKPAEFRTEWSALSDEDKEWFKNEADKVL